MLFSQVNNNRPGTDIFRGKIVNLVIDCRVTQTTQRVQFDSSCLPFKLEGNTTCKFHRSTSNLEGGGGELPFENFGDAHRLSLFTGENHGFWSNLGPVQDETPLVLAVKVSFKVALEEIMPNAVIILSVLKWYLLR